MRWNLNKSKRDVVASEGFHLVILESLTYVHALTSWAYENSRNSNPSRVLVEEDGLQHRAMVLACALAEAEDVGKMVVKKVKARGNRMGWDGSN